jgi:hypothetical protein
VTVYAIGTRRDNAELIRDCATLGYLRPEWRTLDCTYGLGRFWKLWHPTVLVASDLHPVSPEINAWDFTALPGPDREFDAVVFDPPYKLNGTGGSHASDLGYGVANNDTWQARHDLIRRGITECVRVCRPKGYVLVKCQDQVVSGRKRWQTMEFTRHAETLGCALVDMLHVQGSRPQPEGRRQVHSRGDYSTLLVLRNP